MADKAASIKIKINGSEAKGGIRDIESETKRAAGGMKGALHSAFSEGMKGGAEAVKGLLSTVKGAVGAIGGLLGGLGMADLARGALEANSKFGDLSAGIRFAGGSMKDVVGITKQLQITAVETAHDSMKLVDVFEGIRRETGSIDYATDAIEDVATAARGGHKSLEQMGNVAGTLSEKFGIAAGDELKDTLADVIGLSEKGGVEFGDLSEKLGLIGAFAKEAGLQGREGFGQMVGMLNLADNANGSFKKGITAVGGLLEQLGTTAGKNKIGAALGLSGASMKGNAAQQIEAILKATKGQKSQLEKAFGGEQLKLLVDLGKTYSAAFDSTKGDVKTKTAAAVGAIQSAFGEASKSTVTWADITKEAAAEMNESPQKVAQATEKLRQAFQSEKMQAALGRIIDKLPALAEALEKLLNFALDNPLAAGGAIVGGTFAKGALEAAITSAFKTGGSSAAASIAAALGGGGSGIGGIASALGGFGPAVLVFGAAAALFYAASKYQAEQDQKKRDAEAADAQKMLKGKAGPMGGAYQIAGALEAAGAGPIDPNTAISDDTAGRATSNEANHDKADAERLLAKGKRNEDLLAMTKGWGAKYGFDVNSTPGSQGGQVTTDTMAGGFSGAASHGVPTTPYAATAAPAAPSGGGSAPTWDPALLSQMMAAGVASKELRVRVTNPNDIGAGGGPTGGGNVTPGNKPR